MSKATPSEQSDVYRATDFRQRVSDALACERVDLAAAIDGLLEANLIPMVGPGMPATIAIWADAARLLAAVAGQKVLPASDAGVAERICAMPRRLSPRFVAGASAATRSFGTDIASLLRHRLPGAAGCPTVSVSRSDAGVALYGKIDATDIGGPKQRYYDVSPAIAEAAPGRWWPPTKSVLFPPSALVRFGDILNESVRTQRPTPATGGRAL